MPPTPQNPASGQPPAVAVPPNPAVVVDPNAAAPVVSNPTAVPVSVPPVAADTAAPQPAATVPVAEPVYAAQPQAPLQSIPDTVSAAAPIAAPAAAPPTAAVSEPNSGAAVQPAAGTPAPQVSPPAVQMQAMAPQSGAYDTVRKAGLAGMIGSGLAFIAAFATVLGANYNFVPVIPVALAMATAAFFVYQGGAMKTTVTLLKILFITTAVTILYALIRGGFLAVLWAVVLYFAYKAFADLYKENLTTSAKFWEAKAK